MELVAEVRSPDPMNAPLASILRLPLGLDIWEVKATRIVLRANEAQLDRLRQMGFEVRQIVETEKHVAAFATDENIAGYHSVESLERDLRELAAKHSDIAGLKQIGESIERRPIWSIRIGARRADPALPTRGAEGSFIVAAVPYSKNDPGVPGGRSPKSPPEAGG